ESPVKRKTEQRIWRPESQRVLIWRRDELCERYRPVGTKQIGCAVFDLPQRPMSLSYCKHHRNRKPDHFHDVPRLVKINVVLAALPESDQLGELFVGQRLSHFLKC